MVSAFVNAYVEETKVPVVGVSCSKAVPPSQNGSPGLLTIGMRYAG